MRLVAAWRRALTLALALAVLFGSSVPGAVPVSRAAGEESPSDFGISDPETTAFSSDAELDQALSSMRTLGVGWHRAIFYWGSIETSNDVWWWRDYDPYVDRIRSAGISIMAQVAYTAPWASSGSTDRYPPRNYDDWYDYVYHLVSRYGSRANGLGSDYGRNQIHYWEIWNEPDIPGFWAGTPSEYARLLATAYQAVKAADPTAKVLLGGLARAGALHDPEFPEKILGDPVYPAGQYFDIYNIHLNQHPMEVVRRIIEDDEEMLRTYGYDYDSRPLWVTEGGYPSDASFQNISAYQGGQTAQSLYVADWVDLVRALGAAKVFWYRLRDRTPVVAAQDTSGLMSPSFVPKPAFSTYQQSIRLNRSYSERAYRQPITASSAQSGYEPRTLVDYDRETFWRADGKSSSQWVTVDLGRRHSIYEVMVHWKYRYASSFQILVSDDNRTWTQVFSQTNGTGGLGVYQLSGTGRYVKINLTKKGWPDGQGGYEIFDLAVFGDPV